MSSPTTDIRGRDWRPSGGGEAGMLIRRIDWSATAIGPMAEWPVALRVTLQTILDSNHPMFLWWGDELIQFYNDAYRPSFGEGKHPRAMGQAGRKCWEEIWPIIGPQIDQVMSRGVPTWHEDALVPIFRNARIEEVYWTYGYSPVLGDEGAIQGVLVVCTETTTGVLANRRLELSARVAERVGAATRPGQVLEEALACFEEGPEDIPFAVAFDADGEPTRSIGLDPTQRDALGSHLLDLAADDGHRWARLARPLAIPPWPEPVTDVFLTRMDGRGSLLFGLSPRLPFDQAYRDFLLHLSDAITKACERVAAIAMRYSVEAERQDLLMQAPVATALAVGPELRFELANPLYVEMVGREVVGKTYLEAFPELRDTPVWEAVEGAYLQGRPFSTNEMLLVLDSAEGPRDHYFKFNLQPIRDPEGEVYGLMAVAVDITELVEARKAQTLAHDALRKAHDERSELVAKLEAANRAKDEFLAVLGHELRNPLAPIVTALELLRMDAGDALPREYEIIQRQVDHMVRLVDDLLDVARISRGKVELKKQRCEIGAVISKAIEMAGPLLEQRRHRLSVDVPEPISWWGDPTRLAQVVANLLTNAARYTDRGGDIRVSATRQGDEVCIVVEDNGVGIAADRLEEIFTMFTQRRSQGGHSTGGLGLGLTLVRTMVELHGGTVSAHSEGPGQGSTFVVRLPLLEAGSEEPAEPVDPSLESMRVLVVDDNVDAALMMAEALRSQGHEVEVAHDGPSALELLDEFTPQAAVLDIGLPVMDGYELARRIQERLDDVRLVAVTGYGQRHDHERSAAAGFAAHLVKPIAFERLLSAIARQSS